MAKRKPKPQSAGGKARAAMPSMAEARRAGGLASKGKGGRKRKPTKCPKCRAKCDSARAAWRHCVTGQKHGEK